jgi:hypothetical protein
MKATEQSTKAVKGQNQTDQTQVPLYAQASPPPMPVLDTPPVWTPPATSPGHDTDIRYWGINE